MKLSPTYEPGKHEAKIYKLWETSGAFQPKYRGSNETFSMVMPPPNANANIHIGTAITLNIEDITIRYNRMLGKATLYVPGADHAGFETQSVYEKHLAKKGKSRFDFSREELYQQIWDFVAENKKGYETQFRRLGASADWSRYTFTLDDKVVERAYATFKKMWQEKLIYRGERLVNFCTFHGTAFADIEVTHKEVKGHLWYIRYPLTDGSGEVTVATTRPETMLGDTAVAVNPNDKKHAKFIGKTVKLPLTNRQIPIIADDMVDVEFGTGAVKITPAHDPNDYEVAQRHDLPMITIIGNDGHLTNEAGESYRGLSVKQARKQVVADLKQQNNLVKVEDHSHNVGHCYKCDTVIEPLLHEQWFIDMKPLAKRAITALEAGKIKFYPASKQDQLITYLHGLRDWNISRQIAWGIPIPAFQNVDDSQDWIFDDRVDQEFIEIDGKKYRRDPDVFDTWFSSSSWPYATLGYPESKELEEFYPLSLMETGGEILYPWVSRMIMLGLYVTGKVPFKAVYIHGYVMAEDGAKMSKSLGNVIDPLPVIEQYGSDALRMGLIAGRAPAVNRGYDPAKIEGARNFCNKLWNIARYVEGKAGEGANTTPKPQTIADHWVLSILQHSAKEIGRLLDDYRFAEGYEMLYHTVWDDIADWYIEASKNGAGQGMLNYVLEVILKIAHPFAPFVTEAIWQSLDKKDLLIIQGWPKPKPGNAAQSARFEAVRTIVSEARAIARNLELNKPAMHYKDSELLTEHHMLVARLANLSEVEVAQTGSSEGFKLTQTSENCWIAVDTKTIDGYLAKLKDKQTTEEQSIKKLSGRLENESYVNNAPKKLVEETRQQLEESRQRLAQIAAEIDILTVKS